jgi:hypothetical protein
MRVMKKLLITAAILTIVAIVAGPATAGGRVQSKRYAGTLTATPNVLRAGDRFDVTGCGYDTSLGNVVVGFTGGGWGAKLDGNGCFTVAGIPALSGDTLSPGTYEVTAWQSVGNRWRVTGETYVAVVQ